MASDTEDLELESLRSAVLASLKSKPSNASDKADSTASPKGEDEDEEEEDLLALRLAALKSKREGSSTNVSTPVSGSPSHQPNQQVQPPPQPLPRNWVETRGNLITIPLQDFSQAPKPPADTSTHLSAGNNSDSGDVAKEERSTKFSRFESSDSESDCDLDDPLLESDKSGSRHISDDSEVSDSEDSAGANSDSDDGNGNSSVSEAGSGKQSSASDREDDDKSAKVHAEKCGNVPNKRGDDVEESSGEENKKVSQKTGKAGDTNGNHKQRTSHSSRYDRRQRLEVSHQRQDDNCHGDRRREKNVPRTRERRDDGCRRDRVGQRQRRDHRRDLERGRRERLPSPEIGSKDRSDRWRRDAREKPSIDDKTYEARQRKFASGASLNIKDRTVTLKDVQRSEVDNGSRSEDYPASNTKRDGELNGDLQKGASAPDSESDISLSSEEIKEEADKSNQVEKDEKVETSKAIESDSDSESETSRFKHNSSSDTKPAISLPESRLITSMKFPKEGFSDAPLRRRPNGGDRPREQRLTADRDSHRGRDDRGLERDRPRRAHLPRHLDRQERSSSRDRPRLSEREPHRHPRDVTTSDRPERKPVGSVDNTPADKKLQSKTPADKKLQSKTPADKKLQSKHDFVSESSESESESVNQGLRSIVQMEKRKEQMDRQHSRDKRNRPREKQTVDSDRRDRGDQGREKKSKHKRDLKDRIGRKRKEEDRRMSDEDAVEVAPEVRRVTLAEDDGQQKKISVMDRLGAATSPERTRGSVKSRLGPVKIETSKPSIELDAVDNVVDDFRCQDQLGPHGDSVKRRHIEIHDGADERTRKRTRLKRGDGRERDTGEIEKQVGSEMLTAAEPPPKRKQLSKSLLSRLSDRPSTPPELEALAGRLSPSLEEEQEQRRVKSRDVDQPPSRDKEHERKSRTRDMWSSSKRKAATLKRSERSPGPEDTRSRDKALDEKIKKIMKQNAAILQRQLEIEEEKKLFCSGR